MARVQGFGMSERKIAIGIDLGTSKCCVGVVRNGKVKILENERGNKTTPSYVAFTDTERLVGEEAKDQATLNPANTVFGVKRIIGRDITDAMMDDVIHKMPYAIMNTSEEGTRIRVSYKGAEEFLLPQQVTAMLLGKMKDLAERHLNCSVEEAVISVPASFSNAQRQATKDAAAIAGLKVLALINEPTAAAIAFQANRRKTDEEVVAVVDFGAGNLNVAVVTVRRGRVAVKAVSGSTAIGGNDIDEVLMKHIYGKFEASFEQTLSKVSARTERLRSYCEKLKRKLTLLPNAHEKWDCFGHDVKLPVTLSRVDFNAMIPSEVHSSLKNCIRRAMETSRLTTEEIDRVVLVGGSSRIPLFQDWLEDIFGTRPLDRSVNPDEAVACGAGLYAAFLIGDNKLEDIIVKDSVPNNFCFSSMGDSNIQHVFEQHSRKTLPQQKEFPFNKHSPFNEKTVEQTFELYEELSGQKNPHRLIGTLCLDDEFRQTTRLITDVIFKIDRCGIFNVIVQLNTDHELTEVVKHYAGKLSKGLLQNAIEREQQFRKDDQDETARMEAMSSLEALDYRLNPEMGESKAKELFPIIEKQISDAVKGNIQWLDVTNTVTKAEYLKRQKKLEKMKNDLDSKMKQYEKEEQDRLAAVTNLESYCSFLETSMGSVVADEAELFAALGDKLEEATEWLKTSERPSKEDCDDRKAGMKEVQVEIERRFEVKRREDERRAAVDDLHKYCSKLEDMKFEGEEIDFVRFYVQRLTEENGRCMKYLSEIEFPSKAECDSRKQRLEKMVCDVEIELEQRRARQLESERRAAIRHLRSRCTDLASLASSFRKSDSRGYKMAALGTITLNETRQWLNEPEKVTKEKCEDQLKIIENYLDTLNGLKERDRLACLGFCKSRFAYVEQTLLTELSFKKERGLCDKVIQTKDDLFRCLETDKFSRKDYDRKLVTFETAVGTLKNKMKIKDPKLL